RETREQVSSILESITDAFVAVDREWRYTYVNGEAERLLRRSREELLGRTLWEAFPEVVGTTSGREFERSMAEQVSVTLEEYSLPLERWIDVRVYPSADGLSIFFHDIATRKEAEQALRQSEERFRALGNSIPQLA